MHAQILLEDGTWLRGRGHGVPGHRLGEFVFNTAMTGYEEVLSDPSYRGQIVVFTTSHVGNTGITRTDLESNEMEAEAFVCKELNRRPDNHRSQLPLDAFLAERGRLAVSDVDTRFLTTHLRTQGCLRGIVSTENISRQELEARLARYIATGSRCEWGSKANAATPPTLPRSKRFRVAVIDFGVKRSILRSLEALGCECIPFPPDFLPADVEAIQPDGLFLSNGPGDPGELCARIPIAKRLRALVDRYPTFGICLGHQLLGLTFGGRVVKLPFGHHAINHPVRIVRGTRDVGQVIITSQNHNYCVAPESVADHFEVTHLHGNDGTLAGMRHRTLPILSVQFHPEAGPGPSDGADLFSQFLNLMEASHAKKK